MKYFKLARKKLWRKSANKELCLLLDYDGTLTPIAPRPEKALLQPRIRTLLKKVASHPRCLLAIVSGRSLADLKKMVKIKNIIYAGNHGLEIEYHGIQVRLFKDPCFQDLLEKLQVELRERMKGLNGVLLEDKKLALAVHYRQVAKKRIPEVKAIVSDLVHAYSVRRQIAVTSGKMVLELRPPLAWGKGDFITWLLRDILKDKKDKAVYYFGDDRTDEDAFKALKGQGFTIVVGKKKRSAAEYYLRNPREVKEVLEQIAQDLGVK
ncbi:MAG: trehalose-phosphatase [bacterium]|nr:trehalose-phosphatase [bacterium]